MCASHNPHGAAIALAPKAAERLAKIAGLLGSDQVGEVFNAASAATRILREHGMTWENLVLRPQVIIRIPAEAQCQRAQPGWRVDVADCQARPDLLSKWEREFLESVRARRSLTEKQAAILARLVQRVRA